MACMHIMQGWNYPPKDPGPLGISRESKNGVVQTLGIPRDSKKGLLGALVIFMDFKKAMIEALRFPKRG